MNETVVAMWFLVVAGIFFAFFVAGLVHLYVRGALAAPAFLHGRRHRDGTVDGAGASSNRSDGVQALPDLLGFDLPSSLAVA